MTDQHAAELQLIRRITRGEESALADFYRDYAPPLYAFIYNRLGGERTDAEDIWQETLLAALRAFPSYRGDSRLFTWLCAIARHKIADHRRKFGRISDAAACSGEWDEESLENVTLLAEDAQSGEVRSQVIETLQALPADYRAALIARYVNERSVTEIANLLGKSYKAAEALLSRARSAFQTAFGGTQNE
jgi:RNA polymerase sigma-70 factor (ECF subfamily)